MSGNDVCGRPNGDWYPTCDVTRSQAYAPRSCHSAAGGEMELSRWDGGWKRDDAAVACLQLAGNGNRRYAASDGGYAPVGCHPFSLRPLFFCGLPIQVPPGMQRFQWSMGARAPSVDPCGPLARRHAPT